MKFRTEYKPEKSDIVLNPEQSVTLLGSCFSDNIGARMRASLWDACSNPCGSLYNPVSIMTMLAALSLPEESCDALLEQSVVMRDDIWVSWLFDSEFARLTERECMEACRAGLANLRDALRRSQVLIVTLGTAYIHTLVDSGATVSNCHKFPASMFVRKMIDVSDTAGVCAEIVNLARKVNPRLKIIFTISPVRHLKEGMHGNNLSKSTLMLGVEELIKQAPGLDVVYFPAYELLMDDLRDYRFYDADLLHPSKEAVEYIWEVFRETYLDEAGNKVLNEGEALNRRVNHRHIVEGSLRSVEFEKETKRELENFISRHPGMLKPRPTFLSERP